MRWIQLLEKEKFTFKIHRLKRYDSVIISSYFNTNNLLIVLDGFVNILKVFTNHQTICLGLLTNNCMIQNYHINKKNINYYYKITAMTFTLLLSIEVNSLMIIKKPTNLLIPYLVYAYSKTLSNYETMLTIFVQKNVKKKIIQLLLHLSEEFGNLNYKNIKIPFRLTHDSLSQIIGSNRVSVTKVMACLQSKHLILHNKAYLIIYDIVKLSEYKNL